MAETSVSICSTALLMIGENDINSFSDNTRAAKLCNALYNIYKEGILQYHPWRFSLRQSDLGGELVTAPLFNWQYQYQLPSDLLRIISIEQDADYEIFGDKLYTNTSPCRIVYQYNVSEAEMPSYFIRAFHHHLAKVFSMSLQEDATKMQIFDVSADKEMSRARSIDSQQQPNISIPETNFTLVNVRA